ncbi:GNAT family N-acetyltransferase [Bacillaceae bacterium S4-13-56]
MVEVRKAGEEDVKGIVRVCSEGYRHTYHELLPQKYIEQTISEFYNEKRVLNETLHVSEGWNGWYVAVDDGDVVGAGGGGFTGEGITELFVLYLDPSRKREGIGSKLLATITEEQAKRGAREQWVSVQKDNFMGIPFYEAVGFVYQGEQPTYSLPEEKGVVSLRYKREFVR